MFLKAIDPTPVLNRPDFHEVFGKTLLRDEVGVRALEFIALPGTIFKTNATVPNTSINCIETEEYPSKQPLYVDRRFCHETSDPSPRIKQCPSKEIILKRMEAMLGLPYVWGGNYHRGVEQMQVHYPFPHGLAKADQELWMMRGVDCTGLLYEATDGFTPRNSSGLIHYGESVKVQGKTLEDWIDALHPMDLIVWKGHVVVVFDRETVIESRNPHGVVRTPIRERLEEILQTRILVTAYDSVEKDKMVFVLRRWIKSSFV